MNGDGIQLAILALMAGMAIPLLVQLFLTARTVQRVSLSIERKLEDTRRDLHGLVVGGRSSGPPEWTAALASAAVPAVIAAVRAFRASVGKDESTTTGNGQPQERTP